MAAEMVPGEQVVWPQLKEGGGGIQGLNPQTPMAQGLQMVEIISLLHLPFLFLVLSQKPAT